jgi:hypothetical protein
MGNSRSDLDEKRIHEFLKPGDVVVGSYSDNGARIRPASTPDTEEEVERRRIAFAQSAAISGGKIYNAGQKVKKKKTTTAKKRTVVQTDDDVAPLTPYETNKELETEKIENIAKSAKVVYLHNQMGRIKMKVEDVLDSEMAYCLVFSNEDAVIFTPNAGETLNFIDQYGNSHEVYYANTTFSWTDNTKQLMILFKRDE